MSHERKFLDTLFSSSTAIVAGTACWTAAGLLGPADSTGTPLSQCWLSAINTGTASSNRIGSQVVADQLILRFRIIPNGASQAYHQHLRFVVFTDSELDGTFPTLAEVFAQSSSIAVNSLGFLNLDNGGRFSILRDKNIILRERGYWNGSNEVSSAFDGELYHEDVIDLKHHKINWDQSGSGGTGNTRAGHIFWAAFWCVQTTSAGVSTPNSNTFPNPPVIQGVARLRFRDVNSL